MKNFWPISTAVLFLIVLDQWHALRQLSEFTQMEQTINDDYWAMLQKCKQ